MTEQQIAEYVEQGKTDGFSPMQVKMQLALMGLKNDQVNSAIPAERMWRIDGRTGKAI